MFVVLSVILFEKNVSSISLGSLNKKGCVLIMKNIRLALVCSRSRIFYLALFLLIQPLGLYPLSKPINKLLILVYS